MKAAGAESDAGRFDGAEQLLEEAKQKVKQQEAGESEWVSMSTKIAFAHCTMGISQLSLHQLSHSGGSRLAADMIPTCGAQLHTGSLLTAWQPPSVTQAQLTTCLRPLDHGLVGHLRTNHQRCM